MTVITKILLVLSGFLALFSGTLKVSAAEYTVTDTAAVSQFTEYIYNNDLKDYQYKVLSSVSFSDGTETYFYILSNKPLAHRPGTNRSMYTLEDDTSWYCLKLPVSSGVVSRHSGSTAASSDTQIFAFGGAGHSVIASTYDVPTRGADGLTGSYSCLADKTGFFPIPPVALKAVELPGVVQAQAKPVLTIAVACLALLVILSVLRNKLPQFLNV